MYGDSKMNAESNAHHYSNSSFYSYAGRITAKNVGNLSVTHSSYHLVNISVLMNVHNIYVSPSRRV